MQVFRRRIDFPGLIAGADAMRSFADAGRGAGQGARAGAGLAAPTATASCAEPDTEFGAEEAEKPSDSDGAVGR
jgi:hypothetical protein